MKNLFYMLLVMGLLGTFVIGCSVAPIASGNSEVATADAVDEVNVKAPKYSETYRGIISSMDIYTYKKGTIEVTPDDATLTTMSHEVTPATKIYVNGRRKSLRHLEIGNHIEVMYNYLKPKKTAYTIRYNYPTP